MYLIITANDHAQTGVIGNGVCEDGAYKPFEIFESAQKELAKILKNDFGTHKSDYLNCHDEEDDSQWINYKNIVSGKPEWDHITVWDGSYERYGYEIVKIAV